MTPIRRCPHCGAPLDDSIPDINLDVYDEEGFPLEVQENIEVKIQEYLDDESPG